jgi:hypothetical protein
VRAAACIALALLAAGCHPLVWHRPTNAPGHITVTEPPADPARRDAEPPRDPGEHLLAFSAGVLGGGGARIVDGESSGHFFLSGEASVHLGTRPWSHWGDDFFIYPEKAWGVNLGFAFLEDDDASVGPLYLEVQRTHKVVIATAAGIALDPDDAVWGPQLTFSFGGLYLRTTYLVDRGVELHLGIVLKIPALITWSR